MPIFGLLNLLSFSALIRSAGLAGGYGGSGTVQHLSAGAALAGVAAFIVFSGGPLAWFAWLLTEAALLAGMIDFWQMVLTRS